MEIVDIEEVLLATNNCTPPEKTTKMRFIHPKPRPRAPIHRTITISIRNPPKNIGSAWESLPVRAALKRRFKIPFVSSTRFDRRTSQVCSALVELSRPEYKAFVTKPCTLQCHCRQVVSFVGLCPIILRSRASKSCRSAPDTSCVPGSTLFGVLAGDFIFSRFCSGKASGLAAVAERCHQLVRGALWRRLCQWC